MNIIIGFGLFLLYSYIAIWWQQVVFHFFYNEMNINFDKAKTPEERMKILGRVLVHTFLFPIFMIVLIRKVGFEKFAVAMINFNWDMVMNPYQGFDNDRPENKA